MLTRSTLAGFALLGYGGVLALASVGLAEDEPAFLGVLVGGLGLLVALGGLLAR